MIYIKKCFGLFLMLFLLCFIRSPVVYATSIGDIYPTTESGWTRVMHTSSSITYSSSGWTTTGKPSGHTASGSTASIKFNFTGTSIRILGGYNITLNPNVDMVIDGLHYYFSEYSTTLLDSPRLLAEYYVSAGTHSVLINGSSGSSMNFWGYEYSNIDTPPSVISVTPANGRSDVALNENLTINFDQNLDSSSGNCSINGISYPIVISNKTISVPFTFTYDTSYSIVINQIKNINGTEMAHNFTWSFKTLKDKTVLQVINIKPPPDSIDIPIDQVVEITFSKNIDIGTLGKVYISSSSVNLSINKTVNANILKISFNQLLDNLKTYNLHIEDVADMIGNKMSNPIDVKFTTSKAGPLVLTSYRPPSGTVPLSQTIELIFNGNVDPSSIKFDLVDDNNNIVSSTVQVIGNKVTILPVLLPSHDYTFTNLVASPICGDLQSIPLTLSLHVMPTTGNGSMDNIVSQNVGFFSDLKSNGLNIILSAIGLFLIFIGSKWLWKKLKLWLHKA